MPSLTQVTSTGIQNSAVGSNQLASSFTVTGNITVGNLYANSGTLGAANLSLTGGVALSNANVSLGDVANLHITGGTNGQILTTNGSGNLTWANAASTGASNARAFGYSMIFGG